jgi:hypothetical protein
MLQCGKLLLCNAKGTVVEWLATNIAKLLRLPESRNISRPLA